MLERLSPSVIELLSELSEAELAVDAGIIGFVYIDLELYDNHDLLRSCTRSGGCDCDPVRVITSRLCRALRDFRAEAERQIFALDGIKT